MRKVTLIELEYTANLISHYEKLVDLPGFILLETKDKNLGRYDILSAYPYDEIKIEQDALFSTDIFAHIQKKLNCSESLGELPFQGGAIGYLSYDLASQIAGIYSPTLPGLENIPLMHLNFYDWAIISDHYLKKVTLFAANYQENTSSIIKEVIERWQSKQLRQVFFNFPNSFTPLISKKDYQQAFNKIHHYLNEGRCYQVNLTQMFKAPYQGDRWEIYKRLSLANPVPYSAFIRCSTSLDLLCFSPERFLKYQEGQLLTSPIKGSEKRHPDPEQDETLKNKLKNSEKNRAENTMIVDLLRNDLGKVAYPGSVKVTRLCSIQSFKAIHHLVSDIEAILEENYSPLEAFAACFPGGSITGAPKREAMRVIAELEPYSRGIYCGSIAYFSHHGPFDSNIAIRTITATKNSLYLAAGGGIVSDSQWEDEYAECFTKIEAIISAMRLLK